jgi:Mor family transcriptional regulator
MTADTNPMRQVTITVPHAVAQKLTEWHDGTLEDAALTALRLYHGIGQTTYAQLLQAAQTLSSSPIKTLRTAIELLAEQANKVKTIPNPKGRPVVNQERDTAIFLRIKEGATQAEVAHAFNISLVRVGQIMAQQRALRGLTSKRKANGQAQPHTNAQPQPQPTPDIGTLFDALDSGMTRATAATTYNLTVEQIDRAYAEYKADLPLNPTKGDKVSAAYAGIHALEAKPEELLTLKESDTPETPRRLAVIPPSMRDKPEPLPPLPADSTPGQSVLDMFETFQLSDQL